MTHALLDSVTNSNGGGISHAVTGKYTSVRHERAKIDGKKTAGEMAKLLSIAISETISAKDLTNAYMLLYGHLPEWHHSGFYKAKGGKKMGRTYFFCDEDLTKLIADWPRLQEKRSEAAAEQLRKQTTIVTGFYYTWDYDYSGTYGKKRNFKVLHTYEGPEANTPRNFTICDRATFERIKCVGQKKYFGWDEPLLSEF